MPDANPWVYRHLPKETRFFRMKKTGTIIELRPNTFPFFSEEWWTSYFMQAPMLVKSKWGELIPKSKAIKIWQEEAKKRYKARMEYLKKLRNSS